MGALCLSRRFTESVECYIPGFDAPMIITVVEISRDKVRLAFEADPRIIIDRSEVAARKQDGYAAQDSKHVDSPRGLPTDPSGGEAAGGESVGVGPAVG